MRCVAALAALAAAASAQDTPAPEVIGKPLPPVPTFDPATTPRPAALPDATPLTLNTNKTVHKGDDDDDDHRAFSEDELNSQYDQYKNEPTVYGHHKALLDAKHTIVAEKRATLHHVKHVYEHRCDKLKEEYHNITEPLDDEISRKKHEAKVKAEKQFTPKFASAKKTKDDADQATHDKYTPQKDAESKNLRSILATAKSDYETKVKSIKQQAADARKTAADDSVMYRVERAAARVGALSPAPLLAMGLVFAAVVAAFAVNRARQPPSEVPIHAAASAEKEAEVVGQYRTV